jgi:hypothetical protein
MRNRRPWIAVIFGIGFFVLPFIASAAGLGLVPCGTSADPNGATGCQACNLVDLINSVIGFALGLSIPIAIVLFAWAGVLYFTSAASEGNIHKAHQIFYSAFVGLAIALGAYLVVETILHTVLDKSYWTDGSGNESWNHINCVGQQDRPMNKTVGDLFGGAVKVDIIFSNAGESSSLVRYCTNGDTYSAKVDACLDSGGEVDLSQSPQVKSYSTTVSGDLQSQLCAVSAQQGLQDCNMAIAIMQNESGGNCGLVGPTGDYGCMQVTCGAAQTFAPSGTFDPGTSCAVINQRMLTDPQLNMQTGVNEIKYCSGQTGGNMAATAACYNGGTLAIQPSKTCIGQQIYACQANPGYAVTRVYVPKVVGTYTQLNGK